MSQKKKASTKKELKKSVNNLYKALMKERTKHDKASDMIAKLKCALDTSQAIGQGKCEAIHGLAEELDYEQEKTEIVSDAMADLVAKVANR